jgi:hypothetical protein
MTTEQEATIKRAREAFVAALDAGVTRELLITALLDAANERDLCIDATKMVNDMFRADSEWLKRMCEEEIKCREVNEVQNIRTVL